MGLLLLTACATDSLPINENPAVCTSLEKPLNTHVDSLVDNGENILGVGADEVLVTGNILASAYDAACE